MIVFEKIGERDIDLILMRCFVAVPEFADIFLAKTEWEKAKVVHVEHSLVDPEFGESDLTVYVEMGDARYALLIENKIDAIAMSNQYQRYLVRGNKGKENGLYDGYAVFITAPQLYLDTNDEAKKYPNSVSYEQLLSFFEDEGLEFEREAIRKAIEKKESGYTVFEVPSITEFWERLNFYILENGFRCKMYYTVRPKGNRARWVQFHSPLKGTTIYFKSEKGFVDLEFTGGLKDSVQVKSCVNPYKDENMHWVSTGKSLSLRIAVNPIDFQTSFDENTDHVHVMLSAVERLTTLCVAMNDLGIFEDKAD